LVPFLAQFDTSGRAGTPVPEAFSLFSMPLHVTDALVGYSTAQGAA
jgi:hypothetical protein